MRRAGDRTSGPISNSLTPGGGAVLVASARFGRQRFKAFARGSALLTKRLEVRLPREEDRARFVELFLSDEFMVFAGVLDAAGANARFDAMLARAHEVPFAKQPVTERASGVIVGYTGVDRFVYEGDEWLEYGYRLAVAARGKGYATEAGQALLTAAAQTFEGTLLGMVDPGNHSSQRVITKLGFDFWKHGRVAGRRTLLYRLTLP